MEKEFSEIFKIRYSEMDYDLILKPSALLQFLQDSASNNAESLGFGYSFVSKNNLAWFLLKYHMEFNDYPSKIYDLTIKTEPRGYNKIFAFRDFELYDNNKLLGRVISTWSLIDIVSKKIVPFQQVLNNNPHMPFFKKRENDLDYQKISPVQKIDIEKIFEIRFDDIDVNRHANNTNYIIWAFEPLGLDFRSKNKLKTLDIVYKKEIKYGAKVISQTEILGKKTNHILKSSETNEDLCLISAEWTEK